MIYKHNENDNKRLIYFFKDQICFTVPLNVFCNDKYYCHEFSSYLLCWEGFSNDNSFDFKVAK